MIQNVPFYISTLVAVRPNINKEESSPWRTNMLTASEISEQIRRDEISWPGELRGDGLLLRLGSPMQPLIDPGHLVDLASQESINTLYAESLHNWDEFELAPSQIVLCATRHPLRLGTAFSAAIASLSHLARVGLATHVTSPWIMPGWNGYLTLELLNTSPAVLRLHRDMPVARLVVWRMDGATTPAVPHSYYGRPEQLGSRYAAEFASQFAAQRAKARI